MNRKCIETLLTGMERIRCNNPPGAMDSEWVYLEKLLYESLEILDNPQRCEHYQILIEEVNDA